MKKTMRRAVSLVAALVIVSSLVVFCSCGEGNTATEKQTSDGQTATTVSTIDIARSFVAGEKAFDGYFVREAGGKSVSKGFKSRIDGFSEAVMIISEMNPPPNIGYIFKLDEGADVKAFTEKLAAEADVEWLCCTFADEVVIDAVGNYVMMMMYQKNGSTLNDSTPAKLKAIFESVLKTAEK